MILRTTSRPQCARALELGNQIRHASLLRRPKRPYTFTQIITLSDGSSFVQRTTSPTPVVVSTKDVRNNPLWNPSSQKLLNVEEDEAGRLAKFRERFGRGWDAEALAGNEEARDGEEDVDQAQPQDSLMDLISGYAQDAQAPGGAAGVQEAKKSSGKGKGGQK